MQGCEYRGNTGSLENAKVVAEAPTPGAKSTTRRPAVSAELRSGQAAPDTRAGESALIQDKRTEASHCLDSLVVHQRTVSQISLRLRYLCRTRPRGLAALDPGLRSWKSLHPTTENRVCNLRAWTESFTANIGMGLSASTATSILAPHRITVRYDSVRWQHPPKRDVGRRYKEFARRRRSAGMCKRSHDNTIPSGAPARTASESVRI